MYGYESNISRIIEVNEQLFKEKKLGRRLQDYYASIHGLLNQFEQYQPYAIGHTIQRFYREELVIFIFLGGLDTLISSQI